MKQEFFYSGELANIQITYRDMIVLECCQCSSKENIEHLKHVAVALLKELDIDATADEMVSSFTFAGYV